MLSYTKVNIEPLMLKYFYQHETTFQIVVFFKIP